MTTKKNKGRNLYMFILPGAYKLQPKMQVVGRHQNVWLPQSQGKSGGPKIL